MGQRSSSGHVAIAAVGCMLLLFSSGHSFYLPRDAPRDFQSGDELQVKVDKLSSAKTQLPYDFYLLKYCKPSEIHNVREYPGLGEDLPGDHREDSVYTFRMRDDQSCQVACISHLDAKSAKDFKEKIDDEYRVNMILDELPVAGLREKISGFGTASTKYEYGFRIGFKGNSSGSNEDKYFIHNHLSFRVLFHKDPITDSARIVGFEVSPISVNHENKGWDEQNHPIVPTCKQYTENLIQAITIPQEVNDEKEIVFTYDVTFKERDIKWASRWDTYLFMNHDDTHWISLFNSLFSGLFYSFGGAFMVIQLLRRDIAKYNRLETLVGEEWKHLHGDVFRAPSNSGLLCVYVGTGVQILAMTLVTMIFVLLGFLSPSSRGEVVTAIVTLWAFMGLFAGYSSARLYKMFKGSKWKRHAMKTAFTFPVILFSVLFVLNALVREKKSFGAIPIGTMFELACSWFGMFAPFVFFGSYFGFKRPVLEHPVKTNDIPRQIPEHILMLPLQTLSIVVGGIIPFIVILFELDFVLTAIWVDKFYNVFGFIWFLFIVFVMFIVTSAEMAVGLCCLQLSMEDYNWWWRSYLVAGMSGLYLFFHSVIFFFQYLEIRNVVSVILYFGCMLIASFALSMMAGTIGFYACLWFVRKIYSTVKVD